MEIITFNSDVNDYSIKYIKMGNSYKIEEINCDFVNPKVFFKILRDSINSIKSNGGKYIMQSVFKAEYLKFMENKTTWKIIGIDGEIYNLSCEIDDFLNNFAVSMGI